MSDLARVLSSVPIQVRRYSGMTETDGVETIFNFAELWILDENHSDGFRVLCAVDVDAGALYSSHGEVWSQ